MHRFSTPIAGRMIASLVAWPLFVLSYQFASVVINPAPFAGDGPPLGILIGLTLIAAPAGFLISALPISLSAWVMTRMGLYEPETRSPVLWAATGGALAIAISVAVSMGLGHTGRPDIVLAAAATVPGIVCALICRRTAVWQDDEG